MKIIMRFKLKETINTIEYLVQSWHIIRDQCQLLLSLPTSSQLLLQIIFNLGRHLTHVSLGANKGC